jgi:DNA-binding Lrp family transcriptional regulator
MLMRRVPNSGRLATMLDPFDHALLNEVQRDDGRTSDALARVVPLSPSAIARRLRRLRSEGWIGRTIALLGKGLGDNRLRALVLVQLALHADRTGKMALLDRLADCERVQFVDEISGEHDFALMLDCRSMDQFVEDSERLLGADPIVRRFETSFVKRSWKFAPFVRLD